MTHTNSPTRFSRWLRYAFANLPFLYRVNIHRRLTLCFIFVIVLMLVGNGVLLWQLHLIRVQMARLNGVNEELIEVLRVHADLLSVYDRLGVLARSEDSARLLRESVTLRKGLLDDAQRTLVTFNYLPPEMKVDQTVLPTLESIERTLPSHLDAITSAAASGEWDAVRFRIERQVQPLESLSSELVKDVTREVEEQRAQAALNISRAERRILLAVPITGFVTLLIAAGLGVAITRSITEPLGRVVEGSKALARGEFEHQISVIGADELAHLGVVFNDTARKLHDLYEDLRQSERELRDVVNTVPAHVWRTSPEGQIDFVNDRWSQFTGLTFEEAFGWKWEAVLHPDDRTRFVANWHSALKNGQAMESEARVWRADGRYCWWFIRNVPLRDETGKLVRWYGTAIDIEDRKQAEQALLKSEERWRSVFENSAIGVALTDLKGCFLATNHVYQTMVGYTEGELRAVSFLELTHEDYRDANWALITELLEGKRQQFQIEKKYLRKDGSSIWVSNNVSLVPGTERVPRFIMALSEDITQRKRAEEGLRRSEAYLAEAQKLTHTGSWVWNVRTDALFWSQEVFRIYDYDPEKMAHPTWDFSERVHPEDRPKFEQRKKRLASTQKERVDSEIDYRIVLPDGTIKHLHSIAHPVIESGDEVVGTVMDVTERKRAEEELRRSEADLLEAQRLSHTGSWKHEIASGNVTVSPEVYRIFGVGPDEVKSTTDFWLNRNHPEDAKRVQELFEESEIQKTDYEADYRIVLPDGIIKHLHAVGHPVLNESGDLVEFVGTVIDVTEQTQARLELEKAFEEIRRLKDRLHDENLALREQIDQAFMFEEIVGSSPALQTVLSSIVKVAPTDSTVLITGETGTGKELIARAIHKHSQRSSRAFISVNCASIPPSLIASELFGHEKGAFTGAVQRRQGRFELANCGTIFLDEVGDLPAEAQVTLLRVLQERQFERVGGNRTLTTDVRVIAATNRDLSAAIAAGTFRSDLFYRLNVFPIEVPPLRKRKEDIPMLVEYFVKRYAEKAGKRIRKIDMNTLEMCQSYPWPGNIRELQNIIERSVILSNGDTLWIEHAWLASPKQVGQELPSPLPDALQNQEREMIEAALAECKGKVAGPKGAAARLGIPRSTLDSKINQLKIKKHKFVSN